MQSTIDANVYVVHALRHHIRRAMTPQQALRTLEIAAEHISRSPQTGPHVVEAMQSLGGKVERWRLLYLWEYLQFDAKAEPNRLIGAHQNASAALRGIAHELKLALLDPVRLAKAIEDQSKRPDC